MRHTPTDPSLRPHRRAFLMTGTGMAAALVLPIGGNWPATTESDVVDADQSEFRGQLWFEHSESDEIAVGYEYEMDAEGTMWLEMDDEALHPFAASERLVESDQEGRMLWLHENDDCWVGYRLVTVA